MVLILSGHLLAFSIGARLDLEADDSEAFRRAFKWLNSRSNHPVVIKDVIKNTILIAFDHFTYRYSIKIVFVDLASFWVPDDHSRGQPVDIQSITKVHNNSLFEVVVLIVSQGTVAWNSVELVLPHPILEERFMEVCIVHRHTLNILQIALLYLFLRVIIIVCMHSSARAPVQEIELVGARRELGDQVADMYIKLIRCNVCFRPHILE